jgi:hypothetical protein
MDRLTDGGRVLDRTERLLSDYLDNERQAVALAPYVYIPLGTPEEEQANVAKAVIQVLVDALEQSVGMSGVYYLGGQRRDTLRG